MKKLKTLNDHAREMARITIKSLSHLPKAERERRLDAFARATKEMEMARYKDHRWTNDELKTLMRMWAAKESVQDIAEALDVTGFAVSKMVVKLRSNGVPLERRTKGHVAGRRNRLWTQGEVEYLIRRRKEEATAESIALDLDRSVLGVFGMLQKLRIERVEVPKYGQGKRRLWNPQFLMASDLGAEAVQ